MRKNLKNMIKAMRLEQRQHKSSFFVYITLRLFVIITMILQLLNRNYENVFLCILTLFLLIIPSFIQVNMKIELPTGLEIILLLFVVAAEILGEIRSYYIRFPIWDTMLHTLNGFLMAAIGFSLVDLLNRNEKLTFRLAPSFMALVAFCFSMTIGIIWEFFEFAMDLFFGLDMQKDTIVHTINTVTLDPTHTNTVVTIDNISDVIINGEYLGLGGYLDIGLFDTMKDLFVNFIGALIFCFIGFFYIKSKGKGRFAHRFIPRLKKQEDDYLKQVQEQKKDSQSP